MTLTKDGGPAFPTEGVSKGGGIYYDGMSLRDYFAAKAMQGIVASNEYNCPHPDGEDIWSTKSHVRRSPAEGWARLHEAEAAEAYRLADAMLKARAQ